MNRRIFTISMRAFWIVIGSIILQATAVTVQGQSIYTWYFNDNTVNGSGTPNLTCTFVNNSLVPQDPTFSTDAKELSGSLQLNGNQYVNLGNPSNLPSGSSARSIGAWAKSFDVTGIRTIFAYGSPVLNQSMFIGQNGTSLVAGAFGNSVSIPNFWQANVWHYVELTFDGSTGRLYGDGVLLTSFAMPQWNVVLSAGYIGRNVNNSENWNGLIDEVGIFNGARSAASIAITIKYATQKVAYWGFDGNCLSNHIDCTPYNTPTFTDNSRGGTNAIHLNGTNQYVDATLPVVTNQTTSAFPSGTNPRSINVWAKTATTTGQRVIFAYGTAATGQSMFIGQNGTSLIAGAYGSALTVPNFWTTGVWHNLCLTYDGVTARLYVDAVLVSSASMTWSLVLSSTPHAYIGRDVDGTSYWSGDIDELQVYKSTLFLPEIQSIGTSTVAPTTITPSALTTSSITLSWANPNPTLTSCTYSVEKSLTSGSGFTVAGNTGSTAATITYTATGLADGTLYYFRVRAKNNSNGITSDYSSTASATTIAIAPSALTAVSGSSSSITINWEDISKTVSGFQIERSLTSGSGYSILTTVAPTVFGYRDTNLPAGITYYYRVTALYSAGTTPYSNVASVATMTTAKQTAIQNALNNLSFQYIYDGRGRVSAKKVPGAGWQYIVYDGRDRVVLTQDANQRATSPYHWTFTKYDAFNRPIATGIKDTTALVTQATMQTVVDNFYARAGAQWGETYKGASGTMHGYSNRCYPMFTTNTAADANKYLTVTYYDNYNFKTDLSFGANYNFATTDIAGQLTTSNTALVGYPTGGKVNVLGTTTFLKNVVYYDAKYRVIQSITDNIKSGWDRTTNVLDFTGQVLNTITTHHTATHADQTVARRFVYDHAHRLNKVFHNANNTGEKQLIQNKYNETSQLVEKNLHSTDNGATFKQSVDYRYNIRGWLLSMNNSQVSSDNGATNDDTNDLFGMELAYNNTFTTGNVVQYNGNISAMKWSQNMALGTIKDVAYNYSYDALNRIIKADYRNNMAGTWANSTNQFNESGYTYDQNGNIKTLKRFGSTGNVLDSMNYSYVANQLMRVKDAGDKTKGFIDGANTGNDYVYNANGNIVSDLNKGLTAANAIQYNYLNLPTQVTKSTNEKIVYTYDAGGSKLMQQVYNAAGTVIKTTEYVGEFIYQGDTLQFINHEEGRVIMKLASGQANSAAAYEYQYNLKDHLGNVRVTFTTKTTTQQYTAGFESANQSTEAGNFLHYPSGGGLINTVPTNAHSGTSSELLNGGTNGTSGKIGVARSFGVMPGDQVQIQASAKYEAPSQTPTDFTGFITSMLSAFSLSPPVGGEVGTPSAGVNTWGTMELGGTGDVVTNSNIPRVYVTIVLFDKNYNVIDFSYQQLQSTGNMSAAYTVKQPGYAYLYVSNEHPTLANVYVDDVSITYTPSSIVASSDYYPFGLTFNSYSRESSVKQDYLYNGKEMQDELNLGWLDYGARMYMSDIGRWGVIDPLAEKSRRWTPYNYCYNNPLIFVDPDGMFSTHTDEDGKVLAVHEDGDTGVYKHEGKGDEAKQDIDKNYSTENTSAGGEKMGESLHELSFADQSLYNETGEVVAADITIDFGSTELTNEVQGILDEDPSMKEYADRASTGNDWDLKSQVKNGSLLYGKYASPRDAGNFAAGAVAQSSYWTSLIQFGYGAYNLSGNNKIGAGIITGLAANLVRANPVAGLTMGYLVGKFGEDKLSQRSIDLGKEHIKNLD